MKNIWDGYRSPGEMGNVICKEHRPDEAGDPIRTGYI